MAINKNHQFHLVNISPWPLTSAIGIILMMSGMIKLFITNNTPLLYLSIYILMLTAYQWWRDITRESTFQGDHSMKVLMGMKWGMALFIVSEIFFFISFFWAFFHTSLTPTIETSMNWPPKGIYPFNPMKIPLLNTIILLTSGITITWSHNSLINKNYSQTLYSLLLTIILGIIFTILQKFEYIEALFSIADSAYGSTFFMMTGFHGIHVIIGTTFLAICLIRHLNNQYSSSHHMGFEASAWYWHFVDFVWLFLYISTYWWGS